MQKGLITGIILGVFMVILAFQNAGKIVVKIFFWEFQSVPVYLLIGISFLFGVILNGLFSFIDKYRLKRLNKKLQNRINDLEEKLIDYRKKEEVDSLNSEDGLNIEGDPGFDYFDDSPKR
jgi:uncharacterized integral membrane protein